MASDAAEQIEVQTDPICADSALATLPPAARWWFLETIGAPTAAQRCAWPTIAAGKNLLISAPTGSGKTLAAFLPILARLLREAKTSGVRCLYVAPYRALINDACMTLRQHASGLEKAFGVTEPLAIATRTGDTKSGARQKLWSDPPTILLCTPESLAVILSRPASLTLFTNLGWLVIDEIHALAGEKRGADLSLSVERLAAGLASVQGIGLSATCPPHRETAQFLVGTGRTCTVACIPDTAPFELIVEPLSTDQQESPPPTADPLLPSPSAKRGERARVRGDQASSDSSVPSYPRPLSPRSAVASQGAKGDLAGSDGPNGRRALADTAIHDHHGHNDTGTPPRGSFMNRLIARLEPELRTNRTTLVFANRRRLAERLAWALRREFPEWADVIGVHHSSLSAARREAVERALKEGRLRVVVCSSSLELGIDIGTADGVILVHPPGGVAKLLQRVGRGGHQPGKLRKGLVLTSGPAELLDAAVTAAASRLRQAEPLSILRAPLDVLCQQLVGMAAQRSWSADEAFALACRAYPYRELARKDFDDCLTYLSGRDCHGDDWLPARLRWDADRFVIADERTTSLVRRNFGCILSEEPRRVRLTDKSTLGEVADDFAERLLPGDRFLLDGRCLEVRRNGPNELLADEVVGMPLTPCWTSDGWPLSAELARRLTCLRRQAAEALRDGSNALIDLLRHDYQLGNEAAVTLAPYFEEQERVSEIPTDNVCLVEAVPGPGIVEYYVHTPLNRSGNDALARVLALRLGRRGCRITSTIADLGFVLFVDETQDLNRDNFAPLLASADFEADLREAVERSELLREQFRRVALVGLMLLRNPEQRRRVGGSDWAERRLFDQVHAHDRDFVLIRQARRELCEERCAAAAARAYLESLDDDAIRLRFLSQVAPFAEHWTQPADGPVESLESASEALKRLHAALVFAGERYARSG